MSEKSVEERIEELIPDNDSLQNLKRAMDITRLGEYCEALLKILSEVLKQSKERGGKVIYNSSRTMR